GLRDGATPMAPAACIGRGRSQPWFRPAGRAVHGLPAAGSDIAAPISRLSDPGGVDQCRFQVNEPVRTTSTALVHRLVTVTQEHPSVGSSARAEGRERLELYSAP